MKKAKQAGLKKSAGQNVKKRQKAETGEPLPAEEFRVGPQGLRVMLRTGPASLTAIEIEHLRDERPADPVTYVEITIYNGILRRRGKDDE